MFLKQALIPVLAGVALMVGCDNKPASTIPTTAPMAAKEPHEILAHLKYLSVRKDYKDLPVITPSDITSLYGNAFWFHDHAATMGISLSAEEIQALGLTDLQKLGYIAPGVSNKDLVEAKGKVAEGKLPSLPNEMLGLDETKLDKLPNNASKDKAVAADYAQVSGAMLRSVYNAGIYRLMKGVPAEIWNDVVVMEVKQNAGNTKAKDVFLGYKGTPIMQVAVTQKADNTYGIIYVLFKVHSKTLVKLAGEAKAGK